jgi:diguanylate cyclase (GGDEF)-like protein/PAS domain S-box-containing protein
MLPRFLLIVCLSGIFGIAAAAPQKPLVAGSEQHYPPFAIGHDASTADGFSVDLWKAVARQSNLDYEIRVAPFHVLLEEFKAGRIDVMLNLAQSPERRKFADFTVPHVTVHAAIFTRDGNSVILNEEDLAGRSLIVVKSDIAYEYARKLRADLVPVDTAEDGLQLLSSGRHDAMLLNKLVGMQTLQKLQIDNIHALPLITNAKQKFSFAVRKGNSELLASINEGMALAKADGTYDTLFDKWFSVYELRPPGFIDIAGYLAPFVLGFIIILGFIIHRRGIDRKRANDLLRETEERWQFALEGAGDGVWDWNVQTGEVLFSRRFKEMLGYAEDEISNRLEEWTSRVHPDDMPKTMADVQAYFDGKTTSYLNEHRIRCKDGSWMWILDRGMVVSHTEAGKPLRMVGTHTDISKLKAFEEIIWKEANFDALTGLPNRRMFYDRLEQEIKKTHRADLPLALLFLDLDRFKEVNDTIGHAKGDLLLQEAARRLSSCVRETDTVARLGGDEFIIILSELRETDIVGRAAQEILARLAEPYRLDNEIAYVSASIGVTLYPHDAANIDGLLKNVDQAMYAAKNQGRNRLSYFTASMQQAAQSRMQLANDLRHALAGGQFHVVYQPIVELPSGNIRKAEALVRWQHPQRGPIGPAEFIPVAEETGLIVEIGNWVFHEAVRQVTRWRELLHPDFQISINKSPVQFYNEADAHLAWLEHMHNAGLPGQCIAIEITESLLLDVSSNVTSTLLAFRDAGMQVSLDDFGTGYSSLSYLKKFDIDYIKIDQSFIRNLSARSDDLALCEAIIEMAHKLGMQVVAEGVETEMQRDLLAAAGCDLAQGYLFSRPVSVAEFERLLAAP